jgi:enterochelin esterase-like enzyme
MKQLASCVVVLTIGFSLVAGMKTEIYGWAAPTENLTAPKNQLVRDQSAAATDPHNRRGPQPQIRYELGKDSLPQPGVPRGRLEGPHLFHSKIIKETVRQYWVYVPAQYTPEKPACVLVFQDGARATNPHGVIRAQQVLENLIAKKQIPVTIGIFITPGQRGSEFPDSIGTGNPNNRDREYDVLDDTYARFIIDEMLPEVEKKYQLTQDPAGRAIGGSSSGAICAFTVAWHRPDAFRNVISFIGSYTNIHGGHVYPDLVQQADKKPIRIFLQDGVNDLRSPQNLERDWHLQNKKMVAAFKGRGYDMAHVFGEGGHSDDHGGAMLPQMLRWIWRDYPGVVPVGDPVAEAAAVVPLKTELFVGFDQDASVNPSGKWTWEQRFGRRNTEYSLTLAMDDGKLSGSMQSKRADEEAATVDIARPVLVGNKLIFDVTRKFGDREFTSTYQGIVHKDRIAGWQLMEFRGTPRDFAWQATRQKDGQ